MSALYAVFERGKIIMGLYEAMGRRFLLPFDSGYEYMRNFFMRSLPPDVPLFNEYHALIVRTGNTCCKKTKPLCSLCSLGYLV